MICIIKIRWFGSIYDTYKERDRIHIRNHFPKYFDVYLDRPDAWLTNDGAFVGVAARLELEQTLEVRAIFYKKIKVRT